MVKRSHDQRLTFLTLTQSLPIELWLGLGVHVPGREPNHGATAAIIAGKIWNRSQRRSIRKPAVNDDHTTEQVGLPWQHARRAKPFVRLYPSETLLAHFDFLARVFQTHGLPLALYVDYHSFFYSHNPDAFTQLGQALHLYGIKLLYAPTPQAKGKIERRHDYWQKRLAPLLAAAASSNCSGPTVCSTNSCPMPTSTKFTVNSVRPRSKPNNASGRTTFRPPSLSQLPVVALRQ